MVISLESDRRDSERPCSLGTRSFAHSSPSVFHPYLARVSLKSLITSDCCHGFGKWTWGAFSVGLWWVC